MPSPKRTPDIFSAARGPYYFEPEGPGWSDYQDDDGIELQSDAEALVYAHSMIRELKADYEDSDCPLHLLVKNWIRKTIFRIAFD